MAELSDAPAGTISPDDNVDFRILPITPDAMAYQYQGDGYAFAWIYSMFNYITEMLLRG